MSRTVTRLRDGWKFTREPNEEPLKPTCDDSNWEDVKVPHDWAIAGPFNRENDIVNRVNKEHVDVEKGTIQITGRSGGLPHVGEGWYRNWVDIPSNHDRRYRLECDGIMSHSKIYCNGEFVGSWPYGYSSFAFDLTDFLKPGESNLIAVHVNNLPKSTRWYPGAGIYRNVRLVELDLVHIDHWGIEITTPEITDSKGTVNIKTRVVDDAKKTDVTVKTTIIDPDGSEVLNESCKVADGVSEQTLVVDNPRRWSLDNTEQYTVRTEILVDNKLTDSLDNRFGFRTLRYDLHDGMFLNEEPIKMKGVCMHHDLGPLGAAVNREALKRQITILQEMGCNAIRTSHNPPDPQLPELASEMGMLIIDELFDEWKYTKMDNGYSILWDEWTEKDVRALIKRDRNHPSVIMWSIGNEINEQSKDDGFEISQFLVDICHDEDPTRPVTAGLNHFGPGNSRKLAATLDIPGWNYQPHNYGHARQALPQHPIYGSETASTVSSRGEYYFPAKDEIHFRRDTLQVNSYDMSYPGWATSPDIEFQAQNAHPFVMGEFVWTGFDYLGEPTPYSEEWPSRSSYFGIVDLGGLPKDRFYLYQSEWSGKDVLHLMPHWTWPGHEGEPITVQCYSSYNNVELFVNNVSQGKERRYVKGRVLLSNYRFIWHDVPYEAGELKVVAYEKGEICAEHSIVTAGGPAAIELIPDRESIKTDGDDMAFVTVRIVDKDGNLCPRADNSLSFSVEGPAEIAGLCNGDATSLESFKGETMKAFNGMCVLYLGSNDAGPGDIKVKVSADGLDDGKAELKAD